MWGAGGRHCQGACHQGAAAWLCAHWGRRACWPLEASMAQRVWSRVRCWTCARASGGRRRPWRPGAPSGPALRSTVTRCGAFPASEGSPPLSCLAHQEGFCKVQIYNYLHVNSFSAGQGVKGRRSPQHPSKSSCTADSVICSKWHRLTTAGCKVMPSPRTIVLGIVVYDTVLLHALIMCRVGGKYIPH